MSNQLSSLASKHCTPCQGNSLLRLSYNIDIGRD